MKVLITNVFGSQNKGDEALLRVLVDGLKEVYGSGVELVAAASDIGRASMDFPDVDFIQSPTYPSPGKAHRARIAYRSLLGLLVGLLPRKWAEHVAPRLFPQFARAALDADCSFACPGGFLHTQTPQFWHQIGQLLLATRLSQDVVMSPMSIGPVDGRLARWLLGHMLGRASTIFVRESASSDVCQSLGLQTLYNPDLALLLPRPRPQTPGKPNHIAATVVRWDAPRNSRSNLVKRYWRDLAASLDSLASETGLPIRFYIQVKGDVPATMEVANRLRHTNWSTVDVPRHEYVEALRSAHVLVASRLHSAIFGLIAGTPVVVIAYLPKALAIMHDLGLGDRVFDISTLDPEALCKAALEATSPRAIEGQDSAVARSRMSVSEFFSYLERTRAES